MGFLLSFYHVIYYIFLLFFRSGNKWVSGRRCVGRVRIICPSLLTRSCWSPASCFHYLPPFFAEFWRSHRGQPRYIGSGWATYWHRGMTAIQGGKFGQTAVHSFTIVNSKLLINQESATLSSFYLPPVLWIGLQKAGTVCIQEVGLDYDALFYQPLV